MLEERSQADSLRALADWLDACPEVTLASGDRLYIVAGHIDEYIAAQAAMHDGASYDDDLSTEDSSLIRAFGPVDVCLIANFTRKRGDVHV